MDEEMWIMRPCKYDRFSPCECCGKCRGADLDEDYDDDPNDAYHRWRDDRDWKERYGNE